MSAVVVPQLRDLCFAHLIESDGPGGAERMLASVATHLQAAGSRNIVIAPAGGEGWLARELSGSGVRVESFRLARPFSPAFAGWLGETLRRNRVDLAHSHEFTMGVYGAWAARRAGIPHLFTMHGGRYYAERLRRRIALRIAAAWSGSVVAVSESLARHLRRDLWLRASRVTTIPNGARGGPGVRSTLRDELKLTDSDRLAVAVGNLYPVKGHAYLVEALGLLATRLPHLHVAIAGRGEREDELRARAEALNIAHRFHLLGLRADVGNVLAGAGRSPCSRRCSPLGQLLRPRSVRCRRCSRAGAPACSSRRETRRPSRAHWVTSCPILRGLAASARRVRSGPPTSIRSTE